MVHFTNSLKDTGRRLCAIALAAALLFPGAMAPSQGAYALAPSTEVDDLLGEFSHAYKRRTVFGAVPGAADAGILWEMPAEGNRTPLLLPHVNDVGRDAFSFPPVSGGAAGVNLLDALNAAVDGLYRDKRFTCSSGGLIVCVSGDAVPWELLSDLHIRLFMKGEPGGHAAETVRRALIDEMSKRGVSVRDDALTLVSGGRERQIRLTVECLSDDDVSPASRLAFRYDPWAYYAGDASRIGVMADALSQMPFDALLDSVWESYQREIAELKSPDAEATVAGSRRKLSRMAALLRMRGMDAEFAAAVLTLARVGEGMLWDDNAPIVSADISRWMDSLDVTVSNYEKVKASIAAALVRRYVSAVIRQASDDPDISRSPRKTLRFFRRQLPARGDLRGAFVRLLRPEGSVNVGERLKSLNDLTESLGLSQDCRARLARLAGMDLNDVVQSVVDDFGRETELGQLAAMLSAQTGFTPDEIRRCIDELSRKRMLALQRRGGEIYVFPLERYVSMMIDVMRSGGAIGQGDNAAYPPAVRAVASLSGERRAAVQELLCEILLRTEHVRDRYDLLTGGYNIPQTAALLGTMPEAAVKAACGVLKSLAVLSDVRKYDGLLYAYDLLKGCERSGHPDDFVSGFTIFFTILSGDLEMRNYAASRVWDIVRTARAQGRDLGALYRSFMKDMPHAAGLAAAFFAVTCYISDCDPRALERVRLLLGGFRSEKEEDMERLLNAVIDCSTFAGKIRIMLSRTFDLLEREKTKDLQKVIRTVNQYYAVCEYERAKRVSILDARSMVSSATFDDLCRSVRAALKKIDNRPKEVPPFGLLLAELIEGINEDRAAGAERSDYVMSAHPALGFPEGLTAQMLVRMNLDVRPSPSAVEEYGPDVLRYEIPYRTRIGMQRVLGRISCGIGQVDGQTVMFVGEIQAFGYWSLPDRLRKRLDDWHKAAIDTLEQKAALLGIRTVYVSHPDTVADHYDLSDANLGKFYLSLRKRGYKDTRRNVVLKLADGVLEKKFLVKQLAQPRSLEAPGLAWFPDVDPSVQFIKEMHIVRDIVLKERTEVHEKDLKIDKARELIQMISEMRHEVGNIIAIATGMIDMYASRLKMETERASDGSSLSPESAALRRDMLAKIVAHADLFRVKGQNLVYHDMAMLGRDRVVTREEDAEEVIRLARTFVDTVTAHLSEMDDMLNLIEIRFRMVYNKDFDVTKSRENIGIMRRLIGEIRSHVNDEPLERNLEVVDTAGYLKEFVEEIRNQRMMRHVQVELFAGDGVPAVKIDRFKLKQVLLNLAKNASQAMFSAPGEKRLHLGVSSDADGSRVFITVRDTGKGIPEKNVDKVFDRYFTSGKADGTGLGLAIARNIIESFGGGITLKSVVGVGTLFEIQLPAAAHTADRRIDADPFIMHANNLAALATLPLLSDSDDPFVRALAGYQANQAYRRFVNKAPLDAVIKVGSIDEGIAGRLVDGERLGAGGKQAEIIPDLTQLSRGITRRSYKDAVSMAIYSETGGITAVPHDLYMNKIVVGRNAKDAVIDLSRGLSENLQQIAAAITVRTGIRTHVVSLRGAILFRNRHRGMVREVIRAGVRVHRAVNPDDPADFEVFWNEIRRRIDEEGSFQSGNMTFLRDGDVMPVFGLRFQSIDFLCGAGGAREGIICAALTEIFGGKMSARLCSKESLDESRPGVDVDAHGGEFSEREKRLLSANGFVSPDTPDAAMTMGTSRWDRVLRSETLIPSTDIAVVATGIKDSIWISGLQGIEFDPETGDKTVYTLRATKRGDAEIFRTVYGCDMADISDRIYVDSDPLKAAAAHFRLGAALCSGGDHEAGIGHLAAAAACPSLPYPVWQEYESARLINEAYAVVAGKGDAQKYVDALELLTQALAVDQRRFLEINPVIVRLASFHREEVYAGYGNSIRRGADAMQENALLKAADGGGWALRDSVHDRDRLRAAVSAVAADIDHMDMPALRIEGGSWKKVAQTI
ncbi:MAG TPA: fructose-bisphosphatase class II, partial [bacterium]|nr:fructose-bisphosphatase class II [bacterium]